MFFIRLTVFFKSKPQILREIKSKQKIQPNHLRFVNINKTEKESDDISWKKTQTFAVLYVQDVTELWPVTIGNPLVKTSSAYTL